jgi:hypothetical protein
VAKEWDAERKVWVWKNDHYRLTNKQKNFVANYNGSVADACRAAGMSAAYGHKLMKEPAVIYALNKKATETQKAVARDIEIGAAKVLIENVRMVAGGIAAKEDRQAFWTKVMLDEEQNMAFRLKAAELLGKAQGDFIERHEHAGVALLVINPYDDARAAEQRTIDAQVVQTDHLIESVLSPEDPYAS